ncbi:transposase [Salmonella enterica subsp. enterica]|uniref:Transposase n=1 Tax=Salmonella enterica I TaxID=59201 RepID=A0A379VQS1_SALET|nr:transposase [Salmonella enterica subsp. enterica]
MTFCSPIPPSDLLSEVDPVAIIDNKRLGHVLEVARQVQRKRTIIAHLNKEMS